jgi:D-3-phosphoglycerate dehydrogenase
VLLLERIHSDADAILEAAGIEIVRQDAAMQPAELAAALADVGFVGIRSKSHIDASVIAASPQLHAIGCFCIGYNQVDLAATGRAGVPVFNSPFSNTRSVAELTIAEIVALHRGRFDKSMAMHAGRWDKSAAGANKIRGRTLGIVGYGHIGTQVSILAEAMGMRVLYHDVAEKLPLGNARSVPLGELLAESDVVTLHVPATDRTDMMIDAAAIRAMKPGAILINNARGSVVDLAALAEALQRQQLRGAAIDVFPDEPAANQAAFTVPLAGLPNVIMTPHVGGSTQEAQAAIARDVAGKLVRYLEVGSTTAAVNVPEVDLPRLRPGQHRILHWHRNVPGVLSRLHGMLAELDVNINAEFLQSDAETSYVILDVDPHQGQMVRDRLREIPETIRVRTLL